jgi:uncharacterized membrane protein YfcA
VAARRTIGQPAWRRELAIMSLTGLGAGLFGGLVGVGGGVIMITLMIGVSKLDQHEAHGTSLVALVFTGVAGATTYGLRGAIDVPAAAALAIPAMFTAGWGARYAHALAEWKLKRCFGAFLVLVSVALLLKDRLPGVAEPVTGWRGIAALAVAGVVSGFVSGMLGVGGGSLMVPAMVLLVGIGQHVAQGTSLLAMVPAGAAGARAHWRYGSVVTRVLPGLIPGIVAGSYIGGNLAVALGDGTLRIVFAGILTWTGLLFLRARRP